MKVLQLINSLSAGGAEKLLVDAAKMYSEKGIDVDVLLLYGEKTPFYNSLSKEKNIKIFSLSESSNVYNPLYIFKLKKYLKMYDVIHVHLFPSIYWVAIAKMISFKKHKIIFTEHNTTNRRRNSKLFKFVDKIIYKQINKIITISDSVDDSLKKHLGAKFKNIYKIYNGINLGEIKNAVGYTKSDLNLPDTTKLIIQVSSFTPQKDQSTVINTMTQLNDNIHLLLVGNGPLKDEKMRLAKELGVHKRVHFLGIRDDVPKLLKSVDIVILSSFFEGLSLSSVEGMISGKPFIASDVPGLTEVVKDAGILFKCGDTTALSTIMNQLLDDKVYSEKIAQACIKKAMNFDINKMTNEYIEIYKTLSQLK